MQSLVASWNILGQMMQLVLFRLWLHRTLRSPGQGLVEYGLILVLIMVVCVAIMGATGQTISSIWYNKLVNNPALTP